MNAPLPLRPSPNAAFSADLEAEAIRLFHSIKNEYIPGEWEPSPVENTYLPLRETLLCMPGILRNFRRTLLASGRLNFPDSPRPKEYYLRWDEALAGQRRAGAWHLAKTLFRLYRHRPFRLEELDDNLVGNPTIYGIYNPLREVPMGIGRRYLRLKGLAPFKAYHLTEAQTRFIYYRGQIGSLIGDRFGRVLEIGAGYGGLCAELLRRFPIGQYLAVELPESVPLAYFYLKSLFDCNIQILYKKDDRIDPSARIVILPPWKLNDLDGEADLMINTMSFQHMMPESVGFYLGHADRLKARHLYLVNRDTKRDPTDLVISEYPIPDYYKTIHNRPWIFGPTAEIVYKRTQ